MKDPAERSAEWERNRIQVDETVRQLRQMGEINVSMESMIHEITGSVGLSEGGNIYTFGELVGSPCL